MADRRHRDHGRRRGISVPAYTTNTQDDHNHILTNSGATGAIVSTKALAKRLLPAAIDAPDCKWAVGLDPLEVQQELPLEVHLWDDVEARGREMPDDVGELVAKAKRDDVACFIYTSGTGGAPKGVMLSHGNILCNCMGAEDLLRKIGLGDEVFLCFLPLSHSYEHTAGQFFPISIGAQIYYAEKRRAAAQQSGRGAPDHHDRGAPALRVHVPAHRARA